MSLRDEAALADAERTLTSIAASEIEFELPPYSLAYLQALHRHLFRDIYDWAGALRTIDLSKGSTRFCTINRIVPEAEIVFRGLAQLNWLEGMERPALVQALAVHYGDLNMVHPFREGNGRAQRLLFEHLIINAGFQIDWWRVDEASWLQANIDAATCDYQGLQAVFDACVGEPIVD